MARRYCSAQDVAEIIPALGDNFDGTGLAPSTVDDLIGEASNQVRILISSRYQLAMIDDEAQPLPESIRYLTRLKAALLAVERFGIHLDPQTYQRIRVQQEFWENIVMNGGLITESEQFVTLDSGSGRKWLRQQVPRDMAKLFESGNRKY